MRHRSAVVAAVALTVASAGRAEASWYFHWWCQGACAAGQARLDGVAGPYGSASDCESARNQKRYEVNSQSGSAGTADDCYDDAGSGGGHGPFAGVRPARLARAYL